MRVTALPPRTYRSHTPEGKIHRRKTVGAKVKCARSLPEAVRQLRDPLGLTFSFSRRLLLPSRLWRHYVLDRLVSKDEPLAMK